jgi:hypothetical protein
MRLSCNDGAGGGCECWRARMPEGQHAGRLGAIIGKTPLLNIGGCGRLADVADRMPLFPYAAGPTA